MRSRTASVGFLKSQHTISPSRSCGSCASRAWPARRCCLPLLWALVLSNFPWSKPFLAIWDTRVGLEIDQISFSRSLQHWINDGLMTLFFFVVALELKREIVLGELRDLRTITLSLAAALGGMAAALFLLLRGGSDGWHGWGVVMATDTAFVIGALAVLGARIPLSLRLFLQSLAIFDDVGAILVVAIGYGGSISWLPIALAGTGFALVAVTSRLGIRSIPAYFAIGGAIWLALDSGGIHPTLAGCASVEALTAQRKQKSTPRWPGSGRLKGA